MWNLSLSVRNVLSTKTLNHTGMFGKVKAAQKDKGKKNTWSYCWEKQDIERSLEQFHGDVGNTFPVEIKFGDKSVRRGLLHLSITSRLRQKVPSTSIQERDSKIWAKLIQLTAQESSTMSVTRLPFEIWIVIVYAACLVPGTATLQCPDIMLQSSLRIRP